VCAGDYHRYLSEFQDGDVRKTSSSDALAAYDSASTIANGALAPTHPIRLGLALNFSVFFYEILNSPGERESRHATLFSKKKENVAWQNYG